MSWYRFNCICPGCGGGEPKNWYHSEESCCSTNGWLYINGECNIKCDECIDKRNKKPSYPRPNNKSSFWRHSSYLSIMFPT